MNKLIFVFTIFLSFLLNAQTSEFRRNFNTTSGQPLAGYSNYIFLVPQTNTYPTGALVLTEDALRPGVYYRTNVPDGEYKIYIDVDRDGPGTPTLYLQHYWIGENRLSVIADNFDATDSYKLKETGIKDGAITLPKLSQSVLDYVGSGGTITNNPDDVTLESKPSSRIGIKDSYISNILQDSVKKWTTGDSFVTPEKFGAKGDGVTDDATAIYNTLYYNKGKTILFSGQYKINSQVHIDLQGESISLVFDPDAKITSTSQSSYGNTYYPDALFRITNGKRVIISGLQIEAKKTGVLPGLNYNLNYINTQDDTANFLCAFKIDSTEEAILSNVKAKNAIFAGIMISDVDNLYAENCVADSNYYAGMLVRRTKHSVINGGEFSYNGISSTWYGVGYYNYGYGLEFGNALSSSYGRFNEEITVTGVKAFYNVRKGIGTHQAYNLTVQGNHVKGFGITGIDAGNNGYEQWVKDVIIDGNTIEQDSVWYATHCFQTYYPIAIQVGTYAAQNSQVNYSAGSILVTNNIIKNIYSPNMNFAIQSFQSYADNINISNNSISNARFNQAIIAVTSGSEQGGQPTNVLVSGNTIKNISVLGASDNNESGIFITAGKQISINNNVIDAIIVTDTTNAGIKVFQYGTGSDINSVNVKNNFIGGTLRNGIYLYGTGSATVSDNLLNGTFTDFYIYVTPETEQTLLNNYVRGLYTIVGTGAPQSNSLPNILGNGIGNATYVVQTSDSANVVLNTISLDMLRFIDISATFNIRVHVASSSNIVNGYIDYYAYAGNNNNVVGYGFDTLQVAQYVNTSANDFETYCPTVQWVVSGSIATLKFTFPTAYMGYKIDINFDSRLAVIYQKP